jgi:hypothetical protein
MPKEYARLELLQEVTTAAGGKSKEIVFYRPAAKDLFANFEAGGTAKRIEQFVSATVRAVNGGTEPVEFKASELSSGDVMEVVDVLMSLNRDADKIELPEDMGDGINQPIIYTLQHPIRLSAAEDADVIHQIQFEARRLGELTEFLDAAGEAGEFKVFMRLFGTLLGTRLPMTDAIIGALDFSDYYIIRKKIMGKLVASRERWKKTYTS